MLPIILIALFLFPPWAWAFFALLVVAVAAWEWRRLCKFVNAGGTVFQIVIALLFCTVVATYVMPDQNKFGPIAFWALVAASVFWIFVVPLWLLNTWRASHASTDGLAGIAVIVPTLVALLWLRELSPWLLLSFAVLVWIADIAAYFAGKKFGKHKLAPAISPGKTIEGVIGGLLGVTAYFFVWRWLTATYAADQSWTKPLHAQGLVLLVFFLLLGLISVLGDLFESWMKRGAGLKDSSNLLPGHGGILDRIDALTSTLPVAALYVMLIAARV